jgi:hypothetical protein
MGSWTKTSGFNGAVPKTEEPHRALDDALGLLLLLPRRDSGKTLLAQLLDW